MAPVGLQGRDVRRRPDRGLGRRLSETICFVVSCRGGPPSLGPDRVVRASMNDVPKVLVVDDGERSPDRALSAELAELGFASVTTSFEAAEDVLAVLPAPSAILLQLPSTPDATRHQGFRDLAERLKAKPGLTRIPVVVVEPRLSMQALSASHGLGISLGAHALAKPDGL